MPKATVNGINMYYEVHGQREPFVLIMGSSGSLEAWALQSWWELKAGCRRFSWR